MQIILNGLGYRYSKPIFSNVNLTISGTDRIGVIGNNGEGKSTLLKCIAGLLDDYDGQLIRPRNFRFGYLEQTLPQTLESKTFRQSLTDASLDPGAWKIDATLEAFKVPLSLRDQPLASLSGGWQRLALIARMAISEPDMMALDEPTNHLDVEKIVALEEWLNTIVYDVPFIVVSHDRRFLNNCTNRSLFLRNGIVTTFQYAYDRARELLLDKDKADFSQRERELSQLKRLESSAKFQREIGKNNYSDAALQKAKQMEKRAADLRSQLTEVYQEQRRDIVLTADTLSSKRVLSIKNTVIHDPVGNPLIHIENFTVNKGDRIVLLGPNGTGKSQFLRQLAVAGKEAGLLGDHGIKFAPTIKIAYVDQHLRDVPRTMTLHEFISVSMCAEANDTRIASMLVNAGFAFTMHQTPIRKLSQGQIARLNFLALRLLEPNFFLMDEPTNHLDVEGQEKLEQEILKEEAATILASHDRAFIRNIGSRFIEIHRNRLREHDNPDLFFQ